MALLDKVLGTGSIGDLIKEIVGAFKLTPAAKAEVDQQLREHEAKLAEIDANLEAKLADAASQNIQAEAKSGDKFTSRARPTFMYNVNIILACNYIIFPLIGRKPVDFPEALFWLFGAAVLGYTGARSWEKRQTVTK
jgi:hypothetical protein